jgi:hypothetical protein
MTDNGLDDNGLDDNGLDDNGLDDNGLDDNGLDDNGLDKDELLAWLLVLSLVPTETQPEVYPLLIEDENDTDNW